MAACLSVCLCVMLLGHFCYFSLRRALRLRVSYLDIGEELIICGEMVVRFSRKAEYDRTRESRSNLPIISTSINSKHPQKIGGVKWVYRVSKNSVAKVHGWPTQMFWTGAKA